MFKNLSVATKLGLGFATLVLLGLLQAGYSWLGLRSAAADIKLLAEDRMVKVDQLADVKDNANVVARSVRNIVLLQDEAQKQAEKKRINEATAKSGELLDALAGSIRSEAGKALLKTIHDARQTYEASLARVIDLGLADKDAEAVTALLKDVRPLQAAYFKALDAASDFQRGSASQPPVPI